MGMFYTESCTSRVKTRVCQHRTGHKKGQCHVRVPTEGPYTGGVGRETRSARGGPAERDPSTPGTPTPIATST